MKLVLGFVFILILLGCSNSNDKYEYYKGKRYRISKIKVNNGNRFVTFIVPKHPSIGTTIYVEETVEVK